jgi:hypothetical protein
MTNLSQPEKSRLISVFRWTLGYMEKVFQGYADNFESGLSICWNDEVWCRGAWVAYEPGQIHRAWISLRVATDVLPLLVHACSEKCIENLAKPAFGYVQRPHLGGLDIERHRLIYVDHLNFLPAKFECIGRRRSAWCRKAELSGR